MKSPQTIDCQLTIDTLSDIAACMVEHHELLDSNRTLNFIDHYRAYVQRYSDGKATEATLATFDSFITSQVLLNSVSSYIAEESGEQVIPPVAIYR